MSVGKAKILIGSDYYLPHWTGIVKGIHSLVTNLDFDFTIVTARYKDNLLNEENINGIKIIRAKPLFKFSRATVSIAAIFSFAKEVRTCDTVMINSPCSNILPYSILAKAHGKRLIIFHQGDLKLRSGIINRIIELGFWFCTLLSCALADVVSTYTEDYANTSSVLRFLPKKRRIMLMPVIASEKPTTTPESLKQIIKTKDDGAVLIGFAGRFAHEKGFDILFEAIPLVIKSVPNAHFVFAGATELGYENFFEEIRDKYERIKQHITMLGLLSSEEELWTFYHGIDLCVISSRSDCFNLVQMEAALCAKPVVCTDIPGARYLVRHTGFGEICRKEDPEDLARAIIEVIRNRERYLVNYKNVKNYLSLDRALDNAKSILIG